MCALVHIFYTVQWLWESSTSKEGIQNAPDDTAQGPGEGGMASLANLAAHRKDLRVPFEKSELLYKSSRSNDLDLKDLRR